MREVSYQVLSDEDLMGRFCLGDISAFEELYRRHAAKIYGFLKLRLKDSVLVEDVFQETFLKVCKNRAKFNSELPFRSCPIRR